MTKNKIVGLIIFSFSLGACSSKEADIQVELRETPYGLAQLKIQALNDGVVIKAVSLDGGKCKIEKLRNEVKLDYGRSLFQSGGCPYNIVKSAVVETGSGSFEFKFR